MSDEAQTPGFTVADAVDLIGRLQAGYQPVVPLTVAPAGRSPLLAALTSDTPQASAVAQNAAACGWPVSPEFMDALVALAGRQRNPNYNGE